MELDYTCKLCGKTSKIPLEQLAAGGGILCPFCKVRFTACNLAEPPPREEPENMTVEENPAKKNRQEATAAEHAFFESFNPAQKEAVTYEGPARAMLVLAGAGSGKTRTMVGRAAYLLQKLNIRPTRIAMLTFTRRAAKEVQERMEAICPGVSGTLFVGTFHRFCLTWLHRCRLLQKNGEQISILDRDDQTALLRKIRSQLLPDGRKEDKDKAMLPEGELLHLISYLNNTRLSLDAYAESFPEALPEIPPLLKQCIQLYAKEKQRLHYLDFDDILAFVDKALSEHPEFRKQLQRSLDYILVDEMQDTSPVQWSILRQLYRPVRLFCVGDDAQSIYGFRGADFASIHEFCQRLPESQLFKLTENYRSCQEILDLANALLEDSPLSYGKNLHAAKGAAGEEAIPRLYQFSDEMLEAEYIATSIQQAIRNGTPPKEIQVLLRSASCGRILETVLKRRGISYRFIGGMSFLQAAHVKDVVSAFEALTQPSHEIAWLRTLTLLKGIGAAGAGKMIEESLAGTSPAEIRSLIAAKLTRKAPDAAEFIRNIQVDDCPPAQCLTQLLAFFQDNRILQNKYDNWQSRRLDLDALITIAQRHRSAAAFLEDFKLDPDSEKQEALQSPSDKLTLITVHSAKGTESDICFIPRMQEGVYPHVRSKSDAEIEEERRILYVAITRARKQLIMTAAPAGNAFQPAPSPFLTPHLKRCLKILRGSSPRGNDFAHPFSFGYKRNRAGWRPEH